MGHWLIAVVVISFASNLDNLGVGIAYGARRIGIPPLSNLSIALAAAIGTAVLGYAGNGFANALQPVYANLIGAASIISVGVWVLWPRSSARPSESSGPIGLIHHPEHADTDRSGDISLRESLALAIGLGINAWAGGFGGGLVGIPPWALAVSTGAFSYLTLWFGDYLGKRTLGNWLGARASIVAGVLLILIGIKELV